MGQECDGFRAFVARLSLEEVFPERQLCTTKGRFFKGISRKVVINVWWKRRRVCPCVRLVSRAPWPLRG